MTALAETLASLHAAILQNPDDDALRLVYADALEDDGDTARAEFIRVQVEIAQGIPKASARKGNRIVDVRARRKYLLERERTLYPGDRCYLPGSKDDYDYVIVEWRRGFIESITLPAADWLAHADALMAAHPLQEVRLTTWPKVYWKGPSADAGYYSYHLPNKWVAHMSDDLMRLQYVAPILLKAEWPRIEFVLPHSEDARPEWLWNQMIVDPFEDTH
jgi:uncharacterized protein (TIGR02996 family)